MRNTGTVVAAVFVGLVLLLYMCTFQVRFTEVAIRKTWGSPDQEAIKEPGLYFKWPRPIQSIVVYDKRIRILEDGTEETRTVDGKNLLLTTFALWRINDPAKFHTNFPAGVEEGAKKLRTTVVTQKHAVVGKHEFTDFVTTDASKRKIRAIENEIRVLVARDATHEYGIEVVEFGVKRLGLPQSVTTAIFEAMRSHEEAKAAKYTAEGEARANDILANARAIERRILAEVDRKVAEIRTDAERVVSEYYKEFNEYPYLRIFLDKLRTVKEALRERSTLVLPTSESPWDVFDPHARLQVPADDKVAGERPEAIPAPTAAGSSP